MIGNDLALDTNIIIAWFRGEEGIADRINKVDNVFIPVTVIGSLFMVLQTRQNPQNISTKSLDL